MLTVDYSEAHALSVGLAEMLSQEDTTVGVGVAALLLTIARLMVPEELSDEAEVRFVQDFCEMVGTYFAGESN